jgi:3-hydroxyisobutyrate dehydrogenase-like beta-hydroxyacid dehydrogenase
MPVNTIAILTPGDMGHSVGNVLRAGGLRVVTCLQGRSPRTAALAREAGIEDVGDYESLVRVADMILSILAPSAAGEVADRVAAAVRSTGARPLFVECNAIAPQTVRAIGARLVATGARFVDAGIIGGPPEPGHADARIYASGGDAGEFAQLRATGLDVRVLGPEIGQASGLKMCYAALTKGLTALATELLVAAKAMGLEEALRAEHSQGQQALLRHFERSLPSMPPKAYRWVGEMEEIAATFEHLGLTPLILQGAAEMYRFVGTTPLGQETPELRTRGQTLDDVVAELAAGLPSRSAESVSGS